MNPTAWALVSIGTALVLYGTIKLPPKRRSYLDMQAIVTERSKYLSDIKKGLTDYLERAELLTNASDLYDLDIYKRELGTYDKTWRWFKKFINIIEKRDKEDALWFKIQNNFITDNVIFTRLKQDDISGEGSIKFIKMRLDSNVSKIHDKKLNKYIKGVYKAEHVAQSYAIFCKLSRDKFSLELSTRKINLRQEREVRESLQKSIGTVYAYIDLLSGGGDLE